MRMWIALKCVRDAEDSLAHEVKGKDGGKLKVGEQSRQINNAQQPKMKEQQ